MPQVIVTLACAWGYKYKLLMHYSYVVKELSTYIQLLYSFVLWVRIATTFGSKDYPLIMCIIFQVYISAASLFSGIHFSSIPALLFNLPT